VYFLDSLEEDISSTDLRDRLRDPQSVAGLIPAAVLGYIVRNQLYV
jgi:nicotinic acid mononucleotide adenylyltransferase